MGGSRNYLRKKGGLSGGLRNSGLNIAPPNTMGWWRMARGSDRSCGSKSHGLGRAVIIDGSSCDSDCVIV